ncbi:MAG TPA: pitrilysin family protein [Ktedonobacterales bacterium]|jgi:predicted Zn-dependent peptidase|nr:pitrilysin family protein [Ktedonobacterales bacterium]
MYQRVTLPNGIRVFTSQIPYLRSVSVAFYFGVGARYEPEVISGASHFIEHMLFKGSERFPTAQSISEAIEGVGGVLDAATDKEVTVYSAKVASQHFDLAMRLITDMARNPLMQAEEIEKERGVIIEELNMYRDSPADWVSVLADEAMWPGQPLGREVAGTRETVSTLSRETLLNYKARHYTPSNLVVSIAGNVSDAQVMETLTALLGDWPDATAPTWTPSPILPTTERVRLETRSTEQTNLCLLTPGIAHNDPRHYAMTLLNAALGDGMSSRLFVELRERLGLAYDIGSGPSYYHGTGAFTISAGVEPKRTEATIRAAIGELRKLRDEPLRADELARVKEYTKGRMALRLEDTYSVAAWMGGQEIITGEPLELDEVMARIDAVTVEQTQALARDLFTGEGLRLAVIGPQKDSAALERLLEM